MIKSQITQSKQQYKQFGYCDQQFGYCYQFGLRNIPFLLKNIENQFLKEEFIA